VPQAPTGVGRGEGVYCGNLEMGHRGLCPLPRKLFVFFVENTIF